MKKYLFFFVFSISYAVYGQNFTSFTSAGTEMQYVPVVFQTGLSNGGNKTINIARNNIHENNTWRAHGIATITAIGYGWGSGGNSIRLDNFTYGRETSSNTGIVVSFIGRVVCDWSQSNVIVFLRGNTTYYTDGNVIRNDGAFTDIAGSQNFSAVAINDPLYNLPKGTYYSDFDINAKNSVFAALASGNVGIGYTNPQNRLDVNGKVHAKEVKIDLLGWPDYVFNESYNLLSLDDVEKHIQEKGHLPHIPSAEEVLKNGVNLGEMNAKLLEKIEELTLYTIEQNKQIKKLQDENKNLQVQSKRIEKLEKQMEQILSEKK